MKNKPENTLESKINKLKLVHYIAVQMNKTHSTKDLLEIILERCLELTGAKTGSVMLINKKENVLDIAAYKNIPVKTAEGTKLRVGEGITGWVALTGNPKLVNSAKQDPLYVKVREDLVAELAVPIKTERELIGVISVDSNKENAFNEDDLELLTMVAELAAQIILKDTMQEKLEHKITAQAILISAINIIEEQEGIKEIFDSVMEVLKDKMGIIRGMLVLFDKQDPGSLKISCGYRISDDAIKKGHYKVGEGIIGNTVLQGQTISVEDLSKESMYLNKLQIKRTTGAKISFISAPIKAGDNVLGVLAVEKPYSEFFEDHVSTITLLGSLIAYRVRSHQRREEETKKLLTENIELRKELKMEYSFKNIIGKSDAIRKVIERVKTVSGTLAPVLITGETGTGKELIAKILHFLSDRRDNKLVSVNCAAIPETLLESELFGYEKGAFTGANTNKKGKFELADGGTLFLDEIGDMPLNLQSKLLRAIQEKEIEPLGSEKTVKVDIRIITATNRNLKKQVEDGKFRADLYFRLNVVNIELPPLRERREDILLLADFFLRRFASSYSKQIDAIDSRAQEAFLNYAWPGNIRELENLIERAVIMSKGNVLDAGLFTETLGADKGSAGGSINLRELANREVSDSGQNGVFDIAVGKVEKALIEEALKKTNFNKLQTAQLLGINRNTLKAKMKKYGI